MLSETLGFFGGVGDTNFVLVFRAAYKLEGVLEQFAHEEGANI